MTLSSTPPRCDRRALLAGLVVVACLAAGCAGPQATPDPDPAAVVEAWYAALAEDRPGDAWKLLSEDAREGMTQAEFEAMAGRQRDALLAQAERVRALATAQPPAERAIVELGSDHVELVRTRDGWRVVSVTPR